MLGPLKHLLRALLLCTLATQAPAMFIQPDWFEVTEPGVGTNRYSYSFNDPVNQLDPNGNWAFAVPVVAAIAEYLGIAGLFGLTAAETALAVTVAGVGTGVVANSLIEDTVHTQSAQTGLQPDGSIVTPGGTRVPPHGAKGTGQDYIGGYGWSPEEIDGVISDPSAIATQKGKRNQKGKTVNIYFDDDGHWVKVDEDGNLVQASDRESDAGDDRNDPGDIGDYEVVDDD